MYVKAVLLNLPCNPKPIIPEFFCISTKSPLISLRISEGLFFKSKSIVYEFFSISL
nr:MAG TPA: hypothetical protein [Caudoviricetes sp.]